MCHSPPAFCNQGQKEDNQLGQRLSKKMKTSYTTLCETHPEYDAAKCSLFVKDFMPNMLKVPGQKVYDLHRLPWLSDEANKLIDVAFNGIRHHTDAYSMK
jgi:hypothetical protein